MTYFAQNQGWVGGRIAAKIARARMVGAATGATLTITGSV